MSEGDSIRTADARHPARAKEAGGSRSPLVLHEHIRPSGRRGALFCAPRSKALPSWAVPFLV